MMLDCDTSKTRIGTAIITTVDAADAPVRAAAYLDACADRTGADWHLLRAKVYMKQGEYAAAAVLLQQEEKKKPEETVPLLEICFREMGDFQHAYYYACLQRK